MRVLLLYSINGSGHHHASAAIEAALHRCAPTVHVKQVDAVQYTNPVLARLINQTYMGMLKTRPEVWEYLYDNPTLLRRVRRLREMIHRYNSGKLKTLMQRVRPDVVACTQAFPCGMVADYKESHRPDLPLVGVLTDYAPHSYWIFDEVNAYIVPSVAARDRLISYGVEEERIQLLGIPVDPHFAAQPGVETPVTGAGELPLVLLMGGSGGFGPLREMVMALNRLATPCRIHVVTGMNRALYRWCVRRKSTFRHPLTVESYVGHIWALMRQATLLITKPGGLTTAEALAVGLPMIIINPIPGQEAKNAEFLLRHEVAVRARNTDEMALLTEALLRNAGKRAQMRRNALQHGRPNAAFDVARLLLECHPSPWPPRIPSTALVS